MSWLWETTNGTASITAASTQSYLFGTYNPDTQIGPPSVQQTLKEAWTSQYRYPALFQGQTEFPTWKHQFLPVNCVPEMMFLGTATDASPDTITMKQSGLKHSFTARWEYKGGTNPRRIQSVGNTAVMLYEHIGLDIPNNIELTCAWGKFETESDRDALTTVPIYPESIQQPYHGLDSIKWDYGLEAESEWYEAFDVEFSQKQEYGISVVSATEQNLYPETYNAVEVSFKLCMNQNTQWDDYKDRSAHDVAVKVTKPYDTTKYKQILFHDLQIEKIVDTHIAYDGKTLAIVTAKAPYFDVTFTHEGSNFTTYYPTYS